MFQSIKKKLGFVDSSKIVIGSPIEGKTVALSEVNDPTFSQEILGKGIAIEPSIGRVVAPVNGTVELMFETKHALSIVSEEGVELLIHVGLDTVMLKGKHYTTHAKVGDKVVKGDLLLEFDIEKIKAAGYSVITPVIVCNTADYKSIESLVGKAVNPSDDIMYIKK